MKDHNKNTEEQSKDQNKVLSCPTCNKLWHLCQCQTQKVSLTSYPEPTGQESDEADTNYKIDSSARKSGDHENVLDSKRRLDQSLKGKVIASKYEIIDILGAGGSSSVYLCEHIVLKKKVALKILHKNLLENQVAIERLRREAQACANLAHPNLVAVFDFGITDNGFPFLIMEYLEGTSLKELGKLDFDNSIAIALDICDGLKSAHESGIVHRDLKPGNIIVQEANTKRQKATIVDFGIAKTELPGDEAQHLTGTGEVLGSPAYMSPEQIYGQAIDTRTDIYALGCILYETITGKQLFRGHTILAVLDANLKEEMPELARSLTGDKKQLSKLEIILKRCLAKDKQERYESISDLKKDLESLQVTGSESSSLSTINRPAYLLSRILLLIVVLSGFYFFMIDARRHPEEPARELLHEDVSPGRTLELTEYNEDAKRLYKKAFHTCEKTNIRMAAAVEYINCLKKDFETYGPRAYPRVLNELKKVEREADQLIDSCIKNNQSFDINSAALIYFLYSSGLHTSIEQSVNDFVPDQSKYASFVMVEKYACNHNTKIRNQYLDSSKSLQTAIRLIEENRLEKTEADELQLALYNGYLGERLTVLGKEKQAIASFNKAISILEKFDKKYANHLIWWHCDLGRTYLLFNQPFKSKEQHRLARSLLPHTQDLESESYLSIFTNELKSASK